MKKNNFKEVLRKVVLRVPFKVWVLLLSLCLSTYLIRIERHFSIEYKETAFKVEYHSIRETTRE